MGGGGGGGGGGGLLTTSCLNGPVLTLVSEPQIVVHHFRKVPSHITCNINTGSYMCSSRVKHVYVLALGTTG